MNFRIFTPRPWLLVSTFVAFAGASGTHATAATTVIPRAHNPASWMAPEAKSQDLLYVSNVSSVSVYSYPAGKLLGTLAGLYNPVGECADAAGNVFIAGASQIVEFAHAGTTPVAILKDPLYNPESCAVDPLTGDLAVTNYDATSGFPGNVAVYRKARGIPKSYIGYSFYNYFFCGYDAAGNLYVDGSNSSGLTFEFGELKKHSGFIEPASLNHSIVFPGGVQWDGTYLVVGDQTAPALYQFTMKKGVGTLAGTVQLNGAQNVREFWIQGANVLAPSFSSSGSSVLLYAYPAGGAATNVITDGVNYPHAAVVSVAAAR